MRRLRNSAPAGNTLNVPKIVRELEHQEELSSHRKGTFKIDKPFDEALEAILKAKQTPRESLHKS